MKKPVTSAEIDIKDLLKFLGLYKFRIFSITLIAGMIAYAIAYVLPNVYRSESTVKIGTENTKKFTQNDLLSEALGNENAEIETEKEILRSRALVAKAMTNIGFIYRTYEIVKFKLNELYGKNNPFRLITPDKKNLQIYITIVDPKHYRLTSIEGLGLQQTLSEKFKLKIKQIQFLFSKKADGNIYRFDEEINYHGVRFSLHINPKLKLKVGMRYKITYLRKRDAIKKIRKNLHITQSKKESKILHIVYRDNIPLRCAKFTNALAKTYLQESVSEKTKEAGQALKFIDNRFSIVTTSLEKLEEKILKFKKTHPALIRNDNIDTLIQKTSDYDTKITEIEIEEKMLSSLVQRVKSGNKLETLTAAGLDLSETEIPKLMDALRQSSIKLKTLLADYTPMHPEVKKLHYEISQYKKNIIYAINTLKNRLSKRKKLLKKALSRYESLLQQLPKDEKQYGDLMRKFNVNEKIYSYLLEKRAATAIAKASTVNNNRIVDKAMVPEVPVWPKRMLIIAIGMIFGFVISIILSAISYFLDDRIHDEEDIVSAINVPFLGSLPHFKPKEGYIKVFEAPKSMVAESFRTLRTNLQFMFKSEKQSYIITVTSSVAGEGKTTVVSNLAAVIALTGKRVLVIDGDLRKPTLHIKYGMKNSVGLSNYLINQASKDDIIFPIGKNAELYAVFSGPIPPNPNELLGSNKMKELVESLQSEFDYIIFDTSPVGIVSDVLQIAIKSDITLFVFRAEFSKKAFVQNIKYLSERIDGSKGFVLNDVNFRSKKYKYGGYGYGYYEE